MKPREPGFKALYTIARDCCVSRRAFPYNFLDAFNPVSAANQAAEHAVHAVQQNPVNVAQAPPYVYVTVQQPSGGMPEW